MEDPNYSRNSSGHGRGNYKKKQQVDNRPRGSNGHQDRYHTFQMESRNQEHRRESQRYSHSKYKEPTQNLPKEKEKQQAKLADDSPQIEREEITKVESSSESLSPIDCVICTEPIKYFVMGRCNHKQVCLLCSLRRRKLYQEYDCAVCRKILDCVIVTSDQTALFENFDVRQMDSHYDGKFYHLEPYFLEISKMWELACQICNKRNFSSITELEKHVETDHNLQYCKLCLEYRKVFLSEQKLYTPNTLLLHLTEVDPETRVKHEVCEICMQPFYDTESFYHHIQTNCRGGSAPNTYASTPQRSASIQEQFSLIAPQNRNILPSSSTWGRNRTMDVNEDNFPALGNSPSRNSNTSTPTGSWGEKKLEQNTTANANSNSNSNSTPPSRGVQNISSNQRQRQHSDPVVLHFGGLPTARRKK